MINEPILGKNPPHGYDHKPMTWEMFLNLKAWAEKAVNEIGYPVYLVGSALYKTVPRDIDISVIIPLEDYESMYGPLPETQEGYGEYLGTVTTAFFKKNVKHYFDCREALGENIHLDFKICADTWFIEKPKLLLAEPERVRKWLK